jgi:hypothetical protein
MFLHDIGKTIPPRKKRDRRCNQASANCPILDGHNNPPCYKSQWNHFELGKDIIESQGIALGLPDERIAKYAGLLVFCHGLQKPPFEDQPLFTGKGSKKCKINWPAKGDYRTTSLAPYGILRIPLLASIIRIADETDDSWTRAIRGYWFRLQNLDSNNVGKAFRRCIEDIEFCHDGRCLILHIPEMDEMKAAPSLQQAYIDSINKVRTDINTILKNWGQELSKIGVQFDEVYVEHHNHLYKKFQPKTDQNSYPKLCEVVSDSNKKSIEQMLDAMIQLSLGSCEFTQFTWDMLEAQVGRPLTTVDKWLAGRMADASDNHILISEQNKLRIDLTREAVTEIRKKILSS